MSSERRYVWCAECFKRRWRTEELAEEEIVKRDWANMQVYPCPCCKKGFHVGPK